MEENVSGCFFLNTVYLVYIVYLQPCSRPTACMGRLYTS